MGQVSREGWSPAGLVDISYGQVPVVGFHYPHLWTVHLEMAYYGICLGFDIAPNASYVALQEIPAGPSGRCLYVESHYKH